MHLFRLLFKIKLSNMVCYGVVLTVLLFIFADAARASDDTTPSQPRIAAWIRDLGAEQFAVRENAVRQLKSAGKAAVVAVGDVAESSDFEVRRRAFAVLVGIATSEDHLSARAAVDILWELRKSKQVSIHRAAETALNTWKRVAQPKAISMLRAAGVEVYPDGRGGVRQVFWEASKSSELDPPLSILEALPNLRDLTIQRPSSTGLSAIERLPKLTRLNLRFEDINQGQLIHLRGATSLTKLFLYGVNDAGVEDLPRLANLEYLYICGQGLTDQGIKNLPKLPRLRMLELTEARVGRDGLASLEKFDSLRDLNLTSAGIEDADIAMLLKLPNLQSLALSNNPITGHGLKNLRPLSKLLSLTVGRLQISPEGFAHIAKMKSLQCLYLSNTNIDDASLPLIAGLPNLRKLYLSGTALTDKSMPSLSKLTDLQLLNLSSTGLTDSGLAELKPLINLRKLYIHNTKVSAEAVNHLRSINPELSVTSDHREKVRGYDLSDPFGTPKTPVDTVAPGPPTRPNPFQ